MNVRNLFCLLTALAVCLAASRATADWGLPHGSAQNNAVRAITTTVTDVDTVNWETADLMLADGATPVFYEQWPFYVYVPRWYADGVTTKTTVMALRAEDGSVAWESDPLNEGISRSYGSRSSVTVDQADGSVYYPTGGVVYKFDALTGAQDWATTITATNTQAGLGLYDFCNGSVQLGADKIFVTTYGNYLATDQQLVALNKTDGSVAWFAAGTGYGMGTPAYESGLVYSALSASVQCLNEADGTVVWDSADTITLTQSWGAQAGYSYMSSVVLTDGKVLAIDYTFDGWPAGPYYTTSTLTCADAATGNMAWQVTCPNSDCPPLVIGTKVYVLGSSSVGPLNLGCYNLADGSEVFSPVTLAAFGYTYRNYMAATEDCIYIVTNEWPSKLIVVDPVDGSILSSNNGGFSGPVNLDSKGGLYAHRATYGGPSSLVTFGATVPVTLSTFELQ